MTPLARLLVFSLITLLVLITAGLSAQTWLRQQETRILHAAETGLREQLEHAIELTGGPDQAWDDERVTQIAQVTGADLRVVAVPLDEDSAEAFQVSLPIGDTQWLVAARPAPAGERILNLLQRVTLALGVFTLVLGAVLAFLVGVRPLRDRETRSPFVARDRDMRSLSALAKTSLRQQAELDHERDERLRAEAEARLRLQGLNRALEEKIRLGHDLHDGVIQSLYASGLTLQSAQRLADSDPALAASRLEQGLQLINRTIGEVRAYITGLSSRAVRRESLAQDYRDILEELRADRTVSSTIAVDDTAVAMLTDEQLSESLQIVREALSNALRHGGAGSVRLELAAQAEGAVLQIQDDGQGFDAAALAPRGHGLTNMRTRVERTEGIFTLDSRPGTGTSVRALWPVPMPLRPDTDVER